MLASGFPIYVVLLGTASVTLVLFTDVPVIALHQSLFGAVESFALLAIPFFIFAGELMARASIAKRIVALVDEGTGPVRGKIGYTTIATTTLFGAISGSAPATVATVGRLMLPTLRGSNYPDHVSAGLLTSAGTIGVLIPPSIPLIVYGVAANESVPRLFAAGILPGLVVAVMMAALVAVQTRVYGISDGRRFESKNFFQAATKGAFALLPAAIILGGIYGGVFSPTEAAGVACIASIAVGWLIYRDLTSYDIMKCAERTAFLTAQLMIIVAAAGVFSWVLTINQIPQNVADWLVSADLSLFVLLLLVNLALLVLGAFLDPIAAILIVTPLLAPVLAAAGVDLVHLGIIMTLNLAIGLLTPPFGLSLFVAQGALDMPMRVILRGVLPVLLVQLSALAIVTYLPELSTALPSFLFANPNN
ncbi:MAG: TRAP transporter large permease [Pseudomonadota bacterium]